MEKDTLTCRTRFFRCFASRLYIKEVKRHWWTGWEIERTGILPNLYERRNGKYILHKEMRYE